MQISLNPDRICSCGFDDKTAMFSADYFADPYSVLGSLRESCPVHWSRTFGGWLITRFEDVDWCLRSPETFSSRYHTARQVEVLREDLRQLARPLIEMLDGQMVMMQDPPVHTQQRKILQRSFSAAHIAGMEGSIRAIARKLIEEHKQDGRMDFLADFAQPLPGRVLCDFLGVPWKDQPRFVNWGAAVAAFVVNPAGDPDVVHKAMSAFDEMSRYIDGLLSSERTGGERQGNVIEMLTEAERQGHPISRREIVATCIQFLFAGHLTSTLFLTIGLHSLLQHPEQQKVLRAEPSKLPNAIEEMFRFDGPVMVIPGRTAVASISRHGQQIEPGDGVFAALGPTGRDPRQFQTPTVFDIGRKAPRHLQFGSGPHTCIGAPVTRIEAKAAFEELFASLPPLRLDTDQVEWQPVHGIRSAKSLPIAW